MIQTTLGAGRVEEALPVFREVFRAELNDEFGSDWRRFYPFPQIPGYQQRAPVFPSTAD